MQLEKVTNSLLQEVLDLKEYIKLKKSYDDNYDYVCGGAGCCSSSSYNIEDYLSEDEIKEMEKSLKIQKKRLDFLEKHLNLTGENNEVWTYKKYDSLVNLYLYSSSVIFGNIGGNILNQDIIFDIMLIVCGLGYLTYVILTVWI